MSTSVGLQHAEEATRSGVIVRGDSLDARRATHPGHGVDAMPAIHRAPTDPVAEGELWCSPSAPRIPSRDRTTRCSPASGTRTGPISRAPMRSGGTPVARPAAAPASEWPQAPQAHQLPVIPRQLLPYAEVPERRSQPSAGSIERRSHGRRICRAGMEFDDLPGERADRPLQLRPRPAAIQRLRSDAVRSGIRLSYGSTTPVGVDQPVFGAEDEPGHAEALRVPSPAQEQRRRVEVSSGKSTVGLPTDASGKHDVRRAAVVDLIDGADRNPIRPRSTLNTAAPDGRQRQLCVAGTARSIAAPIQTPQLEYCGRSQPRASVRHCRRAPPRSPRAESAKRRRDRFAGRAATSAAPADISEPLPARQRARQRMGAPSSGRGSTSDASAR